MSDFLFTLLAFLAVLIVVVLVHELGHYLVARWSRVRVEVFSLGFGPEIFGFTDRAGTRWKFSALPLGGYVKMLGQSDLHVEGDDDLDEAERRVSFRHKPLGYRTAIVAAGPIANFVFALLSFAGVFMLVGQSYTPAEVVEVLADSAAERAGFAPGDVFVEIDGYSIRRFEEVRQLIPLYPDKVIEIDILRDGRRQTLHATPQPTNRTTPMGDDVGIGVLGVTGPPQVIVRHGPVDALWEGWRQTRRQTSVLLLALGQLVSGNRDAGEIGGPVRIAQMSGAAAKFGFVSLIFFASYLSITLGVINLLPVPVLDGGHLMFYIYEAVRGRPPGRRMQEFSLKIGLVLLLSLMVFATFNDLARLPVIKYVVNLVS